MSESIDLEDDPQLQRAFWIIERLAWALFAVILLLALLGLTGKGGPFSRVSSTFENVTVDYPRVTRFRGDDRLTLDLAPKSSEASVTIDEALLAYFEIDAVEPEPMLEELASEARRYKFAAAPGSRARVTIHIRPKKPALSTEGFIEIDGRKFPINSLILP